MTVAPRGSPGAAAVVDSGDDTPSSDGGESGSGGSGGSGSSGGSGGEESIERQHGDQVRAKSRPPKNRIPAIRVILSTVAGSHSRRNPKARRNMRSARRFTILSTALVGVLAMLALPGVAAAKHGDRNHDRIPDRWEKRHHLSLKVSQANRDQDQRPAGQPAEFLAGDNPRDDDSDDDGVMDGDENAGTIASFDAETGRLTIALFGGETHERARQQRNRDQVRARAGFDDRLRLPRGRRQLRSGIVQLRPRQTPTTTRRNCTTADLVPGAVIDEADLKLANGTATFEEVELGS